MPEAISKVRFLIIGSNAPPKSRFKGKVSADSIFGNDGLFEYSSRYAKEESDKDFNFDSIFDYSGRYADNKLNFTMSSDGKLDTIEKMKNFIDKGKSVLNKDGSIIWEFVFSPKNIETSDRYNLNNQSDYAAVISKIMPTYLKQIGFDPNNVSWWQDYHPDNRTSIEPHPHIHLYFYENIQDRERGKLKKKDLNLFKRLMANEMIKRQDNTKYREMFDNINLNKKKVLDYSKRFDLSKVKSVQDLYKVLPSSGRLQYNSANMIPYRKTIDSVVEQLLNSRECVNMWREYNRSLDNYDSMVNNISGSDISMRKTTEIAKLKIEIANYILSEKKNYSTSVKTKSSSGSSGENKYSRKTGDNSIRFKRFINGALSRRQKEIEDEIDEFLRSIKKDSDYNY